MLYRLPIESKTKAVGLLPTEANTVLTPAGVILLILSEPELAIYRSPFLAKAMPLGVSPVTPNWVT